MKVSIWRGILVVLIVGAFPLFAQTIALNPTVTVLSEPTGPVLAECDDDAAPDLRPPVAERPRAPQPMPVPAPVSTPPAAPSGDLRAQLRAAHAAAAARDLEGLTAGLTRAKAMLATAPAADRAVANDVIAVLEDVARLLQYQFNTPTGSFFDASVQGGSLLRTLMKYPAYESFIERQTITDGSGVRYYPTRESIDFLLAIASDRMSASGQPIVTRPADPAPQRTADRPAPQPQPATGGQVRTAPPPTRTTDATRAPRQESPARARASRPPATRRAPAPSRDRRPDDDLLPSRRDVVAPSTTASKSVDELPVTTTTPPAMVTDPVLETAPVDTAATSAGETMATTATDTATAAPREEEAQPVSTARRIVLPLVLILIGLVVLIALFRSSS